MPEKYSKDTFQPNQLLDRTLLFRPPDWLSEKLQDTTLLNENTRKMGTSFR